VFTTIQLPIVSGKIKDISAVLDHKKKMPSDSKREIDLLRRLIEVTAEKKRGRAKMPVLLGLCRDVLVAYKNRGGEQKVAYQAVMAAFTVFQALGLTTESNVMKALLDVISGRYGDSNGLLWDDVL
jgi:Mor family transcriptional regulator